MTTLALPDLLAFAWFLGAWIAYSYVIEKTAKGRSGLNALMNTYRDEWMEQLLARGCVIEMPFGQAGQGGSAVQAGQGG